jgi:hypothetical protein
MTAGPKRLLLALFMALVSGVAAYSWVAIRVPRYRSVTFLLVGVPTNGSFAKSFPQQLAKATPGIIRLEMFPTRITTPNLSTNGYKFQVVAAGDTPDKARVASRLALDHLWQTLPDYGSVPMFAYYPADTHEYSLMTDLLKPWFRSIKAKLK